MIYMKDFENVYKKLGNKYFIGELEYVPDILLWAKENKKDLGEPHHPVKLIAKSNDTLQMVL